MERLCLNGNWNGECFFENGESDFTFSASVPGCVHTDLMGSRIPKNIYYRDNANACQWIEDRDWKFTKSFRLDAIPSKAKLVFEGLDTYADIYLNGKLLGSSENMFIRHTFDVSALVCEGENTLSVFIHSPIKKTEGLDKRRGAFTTERMHTRRLQCTYGWDWVARLVTAGIWRDVYLDFAEGFAVSNVYVTTEAISPNYAQILIEAETENYTEGGIIDISITDPDGESVYRHRLFCREPSIRQYVDIRDANLWFPLGYGSQPLYTLKIGNIEQKFGIRTVLIEQIPDEVGSPYYRKCLEIKDSVSGNIYDKNTEFSGFRLIVNGVPIMCKGANWVPCEPFPSAETDEKITTLLTLAKEAGLNMLRIWGGGIFEKQHFYNECDRLGILVTQDFLMACGHYPEEKEEFIAELRKEAEFAALELRNHPCLMWWSGDNENAIMGNDEARDYQGRAAIHRGIMPVLAKLDNQRRFLLSSPYGGNLYASKTVGTTHNTQYLGDSIFPYILDSDMKDYKEFFSTLLARFIAEEPTLGAVSFPSLKKFMTEKDIFESTEIWDYHMKGNPDLWFTLFDLLQTFARKVFGEFENGADRFFKMKYNQFEWVRITLENIRRNLGFTNGLIYWMWNDCWPASAGWAFVDYYCLPKASYYSFKRCASELIASIDLKDEYEIYLCNDGLDEKQVKITLFCVQNGLSRPLCTLNAAIAPQTSEKIFALPLTELPKGAILVCDAEFSGRKDRAFYREGDLPLALCSSPKIIAQTQNSITITAEEYVHAVELEGEFIFDDNYFSLLPGEKRTIFFRPATNAQSSELTITGYTVKP